ncbi:uncharacterized protein LOC106654956 [Trichogramma pretiosum]|uniref:uncharacterized protein LOC106654956 n=1 Tax=Trichogramma pretiosum TaxID=7493 RepID=UPI0006C962BE|nr:uncharacterized protein LOC106654956 [Trichogramma pretiosum]
MMSWNQSHASMMLWDQLGSILGSSGDSAGKEQLPTLHAAVRKGKLEQVKHLLRHCEDPNGRSKLDGDTPLHVAAALGSLEIAKILVWNGARVNERNARRLTPLHYALFRAASEELVWFLLESGASLRSGEDDDLDCQDPERHAMTRPDRTPAEAMDHLLFCEIASVNDGLNQACDKQLLLHRCLASGKPRLVKLLIGLGAEVNLRDQHGLDLLRVYFDRMENGVEIPTELDEQVLGLIIDHDADVNSRPQPLTVLRLASGVYELCRMRGLPAEGRRILDAILREIARLDGLGTPPLAKDLAMIENKPPFRDFYRRCGLELELMRGRQFYGSVTFFDLLTRDFARRLGYVHNEDLLRALRNTEQQRSMIERTFPIYAKPIQLRIRRLLLRHDLMSAATRILMQIVRHRLPLDVVMYKIMPHFTTWDMFNLTHCNEQPMCLSFIKDSC